PFRNGVIHSPESPIPTSCVLHMTSYWCHTDVTATQGERHELLSHRSGSSARTPVDARSACRPLDDATEQTGREAVRTEPGAGRAPPTAPREQAPVHPGRPPAGRPAGMRSEPGAVAPIHHPSHPRSIADRG